MKKLCLLFLMVGMAVPGHADEDKMGWLKAFGKKLADSQDSAPEKPSPVIGSRGLADEQTTRKADPSEDTTVPEDENSSSEKTSLEDSAQCGTESSTCKGSVPPTTKKK